MHGPGHNLTSGIVVGISNLNRFLHLGGHFRTQTHTCTRSIQPVVFRGAAFAVRMRKRRSGRWANSPPSTTRALVARIGGECSYPEGVADFLTPPPY